jgi:hypothetical protein
MSYWSKGRVCVLMFLICCAAPKSHGNSLSPRGTKMEQRVASKNAGLWLATVQKLGQRGVILFAEPVHEEITARLYGCNDGDGCEDADIAVEFAGAPVIAGVRWDDDPPFRLDAGEGESTTCKVNETIRFTTQPRCWYDLFKAAKRSAMAGKLPSALTHAPLVARSHFGDLQFLHAMGSQDGETAAETQRRVLMWLEFAWRTSSGEYGLDTRLAEVKIVGFDEFFGKSGWTVQDLFTAGNPVLRTRLREVAFGSVLHTVEDSFPEGHVQREEVSPGACESVPQYSAPPRILEFHSYGHQDEEKHKEMDSRKSFLRTLGNPINVVTIGRPLVELHQNGARWEDVRAYLECIFAIANPGAPSGPGKAYTVRR